MARPVFGRMRGRGYAVAAGAALWAASFPAAAADPEPVYRSHYVGEEGREIKSLSREDMEELRAGAGWGLAKAAELNGMPGPQHVLEMKEEIGLTAEQEEKVGKLYRDMNGKARELGKNLIAGERELNGRFARRDIEAKELGRLLDEIAGTLAALRFTHLAAHLKTLDILTEEQVEKYNELRGYSSGDPCVNIPEGHDPGMWRRHNNCN
jgi:Spy/CpxP family protein refolding chaperone